MSPEISILMPVSSTIYAWLPRPATHHSHPYRERGEGTTDPKPAYLPRTWQTCTSIFWEQYEVTGARLLLLRLNESADVFHGVAQHMRRRGKHRLPSRLEHRELIIAGPAARFEHVVRFRRIQRDRNVGTLHAEILQNIGGRYC